MYHSSENFQFQFRNVIPKHDNTILIFLQTAKLNSILKIFTLLNNQYTTGILNLINIHVCEKRQDTLVQNLIYVFTTRHISRKRFKCAFIALGGLTGTQRCLGKKHDATFVMTHIIYEKRPSEIERDIELDS